MNFKPNIPQASRCGPKKSRKASAKPPFVKKAALSHRATMRWQHFMSWGLIFTAFFCPRNEKLGNIRVNNRHSPTPEEHLACTHGHQVPSSRDRHAPRKGAFRSYIALTRLDKPIGIFLLLWPTLWALWIAGQGHPKLSVVAIFVVGVVLMRSAGCVINDVADRGFDGDVTRTAHRPLVRGDVSVKQALILTVLLLLSAFGLVLLTNTLTIMLAFIGLLLALVYPFMKRFTHLPQVFLGMAFAWSVPMAFAAQMGSVPLGSWYVYSIALLWPVIYDTFYAMVDREDDLSIGIKSTAILWGCYDRLVTQVLQIVFVGMLFALGWHYQFNRLYDIALVLVVGLFVYQQWLIKDRLPDKCFKAFLNNHWVGFVVFVGIYLAMHESLALY